VRAVVQHARAALPRECCGLLLGQFGQILAAWPVPNTAAQPDAFEFDGLSAMRAERAARLCGLELVGYYHSHPHGPPTPSREDRSGSVWPDLLPRWRLIVAPQGAWALYRATGDDWVRLAAGSAPVTP
jgi:proteasome lid subunit RPN8/RPN11